MHYLTNSKIVVSICAILGCFIFVQTACSASKTMYYDELDRLTDTYYDDGYAIKYKYDEIGNILNRQVLTPAQMLPAVPDGDMDFNGTVDIGDALIALRIAVGLIPVSKLYLAHGDVAPLINGQPAPDGIINIADALVILRKVVGLINWNTVSGSAQQTLAAAAPKTTAAALSVSTSSVTLIPSGNGSYTIQGTNMDGVACIQLTIAYDTTTLGSPSVTQGSLASGAMLLANTTTNPGIITIGIMTTTTFSGSGPIAVINFATWNGASAAPTLKKYDLSDTNGRLVSSSGVKTITVASSGCGTVTPAGPLMLNQCSNQTFNFQANTGSYLADVKVDGVSVGIVPSYTFSNIAANHTLTVSFIIPDGDVNNDGVVNIADSDLALSIAVQTVPVTPLALAHGDVAPLVNGVPSPNGAVDMSDALLILRKVKGLVSWNTTCVPAQQGLSATKMAATSASSATSLPSSTSTAKKTTSCSNFYKLYDDKTLLSILTVLEKAESKGKDVVINSGHSMVARKITSCDIDLEFYSDVKQKNLLCTERVSTCVSGN